MGRQSLPYLDVPTRSIRCYTQFLFKDTAEAFPLPVERFGDALNGRIDRGELLPRQMVFVITQLERRMKPVRYIRPAPDALRALIGSRRADVFGKVSGTSDPLDPGANCLTGNPDAVCDAADVYQILIDLYDIRAKQVSDTSEDLHHLPDGIIAVRVECGDDAAGNLGP